MKSARKAMWMVGLATGLSHADPPPRAATSSVRVVDVGRAETQDQPQSWASPDVPHDAPGPAADLAGRVSRTHRPRRLLGLSVPRLP